MSTPVLDSPCAPNSEAGVDGQQLSGDLFRLQQRDDAGRDFLGRYRGAESAAIGVRVSALAVPVAEPLFEPACFGESRKHGVDADVWPQRASEGERECIQRALEQAYAKEEPMPIVPAIDETLTTAPRLARSGASQARIIWYAPTRLME